MITTATKQGPRNYQEDRFVVAEVEDGLLLAVADGHGGVEVAKYAAHHIVSAWKIAYEEMETTPLGELGVARGALLHTVQGLEFRTQYMDAGSTLSIAFIPKHSKVAYVAILGDSPVIVRQPDGKLHISPEHNVRTNATERDAAQGRGAIISGGYMMQHYDGPGIQMSRALGDPELNGVINRRPEIYSVPLGSFLLIGSDGLFDPTHRAASVATTAEHLANQIYEGQDAQALVDSIEPAHDNVTAILWTRDPKTAEQRLIQDYGVPHTAIQMATYPPLTDNCKI